MRFLKLIFFSILVFFLMATIVAFFIPSQIRVLRMVYIPTSNDTVLNSVSDLSKWRKWYPGFDRIELKNPQIKNNKTVAATANGVLLQIKSISDSSVAVQMQKGNRPVTSTWQINMDLNKDSLALQNITEINLHWYPWEKFSSLLLDKSYGDRMQQGLQNLKNQ